MGNLSIQPKALFLDQVYSSILDAICDGTLPAGERLTQESVAERLNVSRQPVGQALVLLKSQGFVCESGRRGLMVAPLELGFVRAIYQLRSALDRLAAGLAARNVDAEAIARGERILRAGERALTTGSVQKLIALDMDFHRFIYELSGNSLIADTMSLYWNHLRRVMSGVIRIQSYRDNIWPEHRAILEAIASGDAQRAAEFSARHVESASDSLQFVLAGKSHAGAPEAPEPVKA